MKQEYEVKVPGKHVPSKPRRSSRESFAAVHALGVIDDRLLTRFRQTYVGLRNRIVHDYDVLDNRVVYFTAKRLVEDARKYVGSVYSYLSEIKDQKR